MTAVLITVAIGTVLTLTLVVSMYAIPIRRTWRKEHHEHLETPGPEVEPEEHLEPYHYVEADEELSEEAEPELAGVGS